MNNETRLFDAAHHARFVRRKNRFVFECRDDGGILEASVANPGRMWEFLEPGAMVALEASGPGSRLAWKAVAIEYRGAWVPLVAARANLLVQDLVLPALCREVGALGRGGEPDFKAEVRLGRHRFDFRINTDPPIYIEVKSCSLVEVGIAMFPDAPSERALGHVEHLAALSGEGNQGKAMVIMAITHGRPAVFIPNIHTDPALSRALAESGLRVEAWSFTCDTHGIARLSGGTSTSARVPVNFEPVLALKGDTGAYFLGLRLQNRLDFEAGGTSFHLEPGWYVYVGSAMGGLEARLRHHAKRPKTSFHWHVDHLSSAAAESVAYPVRSIHRLEDALARAMAGLEAATAIPGFGASDRPGASHLFRLPCRPHELREFREILFRARHLWAFSPPDPH